LSRCRFDRRNDGTLECGGLHVRYAQPVQLLVRTHWWTIPCAFVLRNGSVAGAALFNCEDDYTEPARIVIQRPGKNSDAVFHFICWSDGVCVLSVRDAAVVF